MATNVLKHKPSSETMPMSAQNCRTTSEAMSSFALKCRLTQQGTTGCEVLHPSEIATLTAFRSSPSPEDLPTRKQGSKYEILQPQVPGACTVLRCKSAPEEPEGMSKSYQRKKCEAPHPPEAGASSALTCRPTLPCSILQTGQEVRNCMGDTGRCGHANATEVNSLMGTGKCRGLFLPSVCESEHVQTARVEASDPWRSASVRRSPEGISVRIELGGDTTPHNTFQREDATNTSSGNQHCSHTSRRRQQWDVGFNDLHREDSRISTTTCSCNISSAVEALRRTMERMVLCVDSAATVQETVRSLSTSGILQPLIQHLIDHLIEEATSCGEAPTGHPVFRAENSVSDPVLSMTQEEDWSLQGQVMERDQKLIRAFSQRFIRSLLKELLISLHDHWGENKRATCYSRTPSAKVCAEVRQVFTEVLMQDVTASLSKSKVYSFVSPSPSPSTDSLLSSSSLASEVTTDITPVKTTQIVSSVVATPHTSSPTNPWGEDYQSLVSTLVWQLLFKISQFTVPMEALAQTLTNRVLFEFCTMSGLYKTDAYPLSLMVQNIYRDIYAKLLVEFGTKDNLRRALVARQLSFSRSIVGLLCDELLWQCRQEKMVGVFALNQNRKEAVLVAKVDSNNSSPPKTPPSAKVSSFFKGRHSVKKVYNHCYKLVLSGQCMLPYKPKQQ